MMRADIQGRIDRARKLRQRLQDWMVEAERRIERLTWFVWGLATVAVLQGAATGVLLWLVLARLAVIVAITTPALAHEARTGWQYPRDCCYGTAQTGDCQMIPSRSVKVGGAEFIVTLSQDDHPWVRGAGTITLGIPHGRERVSPDGEYHICLMQAQPYWRCFFAPPPGS